MDVNDFDLDLLKEIGNIGAGNAATALSDMIGETVTISVPRCEWISFSEIGNMLGGPDNVVLGILVQLSQDIEGFILMAQELPDVQNTLKDLLGQDPGPELTLEAAEPMREVCNILTGAYISAISAMTGLQIIPSVPELTIDMAMAIMNVPVLVYGEMGEYVLLLDTQFGGAAESIHGHFFLMPTMDSLEKMKKAMIG